MGAVRQLLDELRHRGVTVHEWPGWDGRGNADGGVGPRVTQIDPVGAVIHHTGSPYGSAYAGLVSSTRPDLYGGVLCNFAGNEDGSLTVIASGLAWHAGPGVGPSLGRVLGKVPNIRSRMNRVTVGLEIVYPGDVPMRPEQYRTACIFGRTVADLFAGGDIECVRAHAETNGNAPGGSGKWDPGYAPGKTIDMAAFRRDAAQVSGGLPAVFQEDSDMRMIQQRDRGIAVVGPGYFKSLTPEELPAAGAMFGAPVIFNTPAEFDRAVAVTTGGQAIIDGKPLLGELHGKVVGSRFGLDGRPGEDVDDMLGHILSIRGALAVLASGGVDVKALAAEILASMDVKTSVQEALREGTGTASPAA